MTIAIHDLLRDKADEFPMPEDAAAVVAVRVWHCRYRTLQALEHFRGLETLVVATWPDTTLAPLVGLERLTYLSVVHLPGVTDLAPLAALARLTTLRLHTLPSWDSSSKRTTVQTLEPLSCLPSLRHLELFGVVPADGSLRALESNQTLESVRVHKYAKSERERFYKSTGMSDAFAPDPLIESWT